MPPEPAPSLPGAEQLPPAGGPSARKLNPLCSPKQAFLGEPFNTQKPKLSLTILPRRGPALPVGPQRCSGPWCCLTVLPCSPALPLAFTARSLPSRQQQDGARGPREVAGTRPYRPRYLPSSSGWAAGGMRGTCPHISPCVLPLPDAFFHSSVH